MAGPIRELLQRQPIRNALRSLVGAPPRYGMMGDRMASVVESDRRQSTNLMGGPRRLGRRQDVQPMEMVSRPSLQTGVPTPEARQMAMSREDDADRRQAQRRQTEGLVGQPAAQPAAEPAGPPADPRAQQIAAIYARSQAQRAQAEQLRQDRSFNSFDQKGDMLRAQYHNTLKAASNDELLALALERERRQEQQAQQLVEENRNEASLQRTAQFPEDSIARDAQKLRQAAIESGIQAAAALRTESQLPGATLDDKNYMALLRRNQIDAAGAVIADRFRNGIPMLSSDPTLSEIASIVQGASPRDPNARAAIVRNMVSAAMQQGRIPPDKASALANAMSLMIERQIRGGR